MTSHSEKYSSYLSDYDPDAGLVLDADGAVLAGNRAANLLAGDEPAAALPTNTRALVTACLRQQRAISGVESRLSGVILLWTFIPEPGAQLVIARGRDASDEIAALDEATRSSRLYRLITENTTDLISRHAPDGRFIDATPASWRLLGYWPEELRGKRLEEIFQVNQAEARLEEVRNRLRDDGYAT